MSKPLIFLAGFALGATVVFVLDRSEILWRKKPIVNQEPKPKDNAEEPEVVEERVTFGPGEVAEPVPTGDAFYDEKLHANGMDTRLSPPVIVADGSVFSTDSELKTANSENNEQQS